MGFDLRLSDLGRARFVGEAAIHKHAMLITRTMVGSPSATRGLQALNFVGNEII